MAVTTDQLAVEIKINSKDASDAIKKLNAGIEKLSSKFSQMGNDADKAANETKNSLVSAANDIIKKQIEIAKVIESRGLSEIQMIQSKSKAQQEEIRYLESFLKMNGQLTEAMSANLSLARETIVVAEKAAISDQQLEILNGIKEKTLEIQRATEVRGKTQEQVAQIERQRALDGLDALEQRLMAEGSLTQAILDQLQAQRNAVNADFNSKLAMTEAKDGQKNVAGLSSHFKKLGASIIVLNQGFQLAMGFFRMVKDAVSKPINAFAEADAQAQKLRNTLNLMGTKDVEGAAAAWENFASKLQRTTTVEGDAALGLVSLAKAAGVSDAMTQKLITASVDLAAVTGRDVNSSFQDLLGSLKGQGKALASVVPGIKNFSEEQLKAGAAIDFMAERFKGFGEAQAKTFSGQMEQMAHLTGDVFEEIGKIIVEAFDLKDAGSLLKDFLIGAIDLLKRFGNGFAAVKGEVMALMPILGSMAVPLAIVFGPAALVALKTWVATFIAAKAPLLLMAVKLAAIAAAVLVVSAAVDILIKNWGRLDKVFKLVIKSAETGFRFMIDMVLSLAKIVVEKLGGGFSKVFKMIGFDGFDSVIDEMSKGIDDKILVNLDYANDSMNEIAETAKDVDFGFAGDMLQKAMGFMDGFNQDLEKAGKLGDKAAKGFKTIPEDMKKAAEEAKKLLADLTKLVDDLSAKRAQASSDNQADIIRGQMAETLKILALKEQEIAIAKGLTTEERARSKALLESGRAHAEVIAALALDELRLKTNEEVLAKNLELEAVIKSNGESAFKAIERERKASQSLIDERIKSLEKEPALNQVAILGLERQKKLVDEIAGAKRKSIIKENLAEGAMMLAGTVTAAFAGAMDIMNGGPLNKVADFGEAIANMPEAFLKAVDRIDQLINKFLGAFPQAINKLVSVLPTVVQKLVDSMPQIAQNIAAALPKMAKAIADSAPAFIGAIMDAIPSLIEGLSSAIQILIAKIPAIVDTVLKKLPAIITTLFKEIPKIFTSVFKMLPSLFEALFENADDLVLPFVQGLLEAMDEIAIAFVDEMIMSGGLERIMGSMLRSIPRIAVAFAQGVLRALNIGFKKMFGGRGSGGFKFPKIEVDAAQATKAIKGFAARLTGENAKLFSVLDMGEGLARAAKGGGPIEKAATAFEDAMKKGGDYLTELWKNFIAGLIDAWRWAYNTFMAPFVSLIKSTWDLVYDSVIKPFFLGLKMIWDTINDTIFKPFFTSLKTQWDAITADFVASFTALVEIFKSAGTAIADNIYSVWTSIIDIFKNSWETVKVLWSTMMDLFSGKITFLEAVKSAFETVFSQAKFGLDSVNGSFEKTFASAKEMFEKAKSSFDDVFKTFTNGANKIGESIWDAIKKGFEGATKLFTDLGMNIWKPLKDGLGGVGDTLKKSLEAIDPGNLFARMFKIDMGGKGTVETALNIDIPFANFARGGTVPNMVPGMAKRAGDHRTNDTVAALLSPGEVVIPRSLMSDPLVKSVISGIMDGTLRQFYKVSVGGKKVIDTGGSGGEINLPPLPPVPPIPVLEQAVAAIDPAKMWEQVKTETYGMIMKMFEANRFHSGGLVPAFAGGGEVPALLRPGEFVVNRGAVSNLGAPFMSSLNRGQAPGDTTVNIEMNIETTEAIDENFVRSRLMPRVKDELKRASLDGQFVLSAKGIR